MVKRKKRVKRIKSERLQRYKEKLKSLNYWKLATIAISSLLIISMFTAGFTNFFKAYPIPKEQAGIKAVNYINKNLIQDKKASLTKVYQENDLYILELRVDNQPFKSFMTKDGIYVFPMGFDTRKSPGLPQPETCS